MEETNIVIESDEKTLSMVKDILNSGTPDTVRALKMNVYGLDVSSGVETDGFKDREKIKEIVRRARNER